MIVFAGCGVAGKRDIEPNSIAARMAEITGAKVIASIDVTDQSMGRGANFRNHEYSRRTWVRFTARAAARTAEHEGHRRAEAAQFRGRGGGRGAGGRGSLAWSKLNPRSATACANEMAGQARPFRTQADRWGGYFRREIGWYSRRVAPV